MTEIKARVPKFKGHEAFNSVVRADWNRAIELNPDSYDAYLYAPSKVLDEAESDLYESENVMELSTNQDTLSYGDPVFVKVLDCADESDHFFTLDDNSANLGESLDPMLLKVAADSVPIGSVLEWDEETPNGIRTVWWYVHRAMGYGTANVGVIYACVPMRDFNQPDLTIIEPELEVEEPELEPELEPEEELEQEFELEVEGDDSGVIIL